MTSKVPFNKGRMTSEYSLWFTLQSREYVNRIDLTKTPCLGEPMERGPAFLSKITHFTIGEEIAFS